MEAAFGGGVSDRGVEDVFVFARAWPAFAEIGQGGYFAYARDLGVSVRGGERVAQEIAQAVFDFAARDA